MYAIRSYYENMKYFGITFCVLLLSTGSPAQVGTWVDVPTPTANWLHDVQFVDADYGFAVGDLGRNNFV